MTDAKRQAMIERIATAIDNEQAHKTIDLGEGYSATVQIIYGATDDAYDCLEIIINDKDGEFVDIGNVSGGFYEYEDKDTKEVMKELAKNVIDKADFDISDSGPSI